MIKIIFFILIFLCFFVVLSGCQNEPKKIDFLDQKISNEKKLEKLLDASNLDEIGIDDAGQKLLFDFYKKRNFKPMWCEKKTLSATGKILENYLKTPIAFGLPSKRFSTLRWDSVYALKNEIIITSMLARMKVDLKIGVLDTETKSLRPIQYVSLDSLQNLLNFSKNKNEIAIKIISWGPADTNYQKLAYGLFHFAFSHPLENIDLKIPTFKKDSINSIIQAKKSLFNKGFLSSETPNDSLFVIALKAFQDENGQQKDGVLGTSTALSLEETNLHRCRRAALAMEKWRWKTTFPEKYIYVNIPEFKLRFYNSDTLRSENKVIVGKPDHQTPEFKAKVRTIVAFPFWSVPYSITSKEILPDVKRNPNYFKRNNMKIYRKGEEIDPSTVNWNKIRENTFPYSVIQDPGVHNSLGIIKFEFSNKFNVYVHDTPSKGLFNTTVRAYSHGCVRCENPIDLAKIVLTQDENTMIPDSLDSIVSRKVNFPIQLKKSFLIQFDYITVIPNNKGGLLFLKDIYFKDEKFLKWMF
jgi:murein L,D-transpeptidase YcbB/YkuD